MVTVREPIVMLQNLGMIRKGHYVYADSSHGEFYVALSKGKTESAELPDELVELCHAMARFSADGVEVVVSAPSGGTAIGKCVAEYLSELLGRKIPFVLLEKTKDNLLAIRPEDVSRVERRSVLIVDDVLHHGTTVRRVLQIVRGIRGTIAGVSVVWNRGDLTPSDLLVPFLYAPIKHKLVSYLPFGFPLPCPLCEEGVSINTDLGHGKEFLARKSAAG